jgi:acetate kinase
MGGVDAVVFTAGIGENDSEVRARATQDLEFLGLYMDHEANCDDSKRGVRDVAKADSPARIYVIPTNEELLIARDTARLALGLKTVS